MTEVIMPKMGDGMEEGVLLEWLKKEGDKVKTGESLATIQTDKATLEMEADGSGTLAGILVKAGDAVPVGKPMAALLADGEKLPGDWGSGASAEPKQEEAPEPVAVASAPAAKKSESEAAPAAKETASPPEVPESKPQAGRVKASPLARKIADELGVSIESLKGSGPGGRIVEKDVRSAAESGIAKKLIDGVSAPVHASEEDVKVPLNRIRQITAQRTAQSKQTVPHFYVTVEVDVESIQALRAQFEAEGAGKVSINDFVIKACASALQDMPQVNATFQGDHLLQYGSVNVGMAVALEDGLTVPVMHGAHRLSVRQISARSRELAAKARENKLSPEELSGSTFSISNMGMLNVENFAAIINTPNAAIVAVSTARKVVVPVESENEEGEVTLEVRTRMNVTGSFDHRVVDGAVGARFMNALRDYLENPTRLLG